MHIGSKPERMSSKLAILMSFRASFAHAGMQLDALSSDQQHLSMSRRYWPQPPIDVFNVPQLEDIEPEAHMASKLDL
jgi:hypothetical protein